MSLRILSIASEMAPLAKTGGLADVTSALTRLLHGLGHDVRAFMPLYGAIDRTHLALSPVEPLREVPLEIGLHRYRYSILTASLPGSSATVYLVDCPALYARSSLYTTDPDEHLRFIVLTRAALESSQRLAFSPQILHCHDWHAAFAPLFVRSLYGWDRLFAATRSVLTIHNIGYQGVFSAGAVGDLQLGPGAYLLHQDDLRSGYINSLKHGILYADAVTTVSPTYAAEIRTPEFGMGLEQVLRARGEAVLGILNGVDYDEWDPRNDRYLTRRYDPAHTSVKAELKSELSRRLGIECRPRTALAGVVSRLAAQKGIDLLLAVLPRVLETRDLACAILGSGEEQFERGFADLQRALPGRIAFCSGYDEELAHWIEGASDLFLMPSRYEPCGLNQMYSLRYGTVPLVRATGGLADTVQRYDPASGTGTGILFRDYSPAAFEQALHTALDLYAVPAHWSRMARNGMAQDFSWHRQVEHYVALFEQLLHASAKRL